MNKTDNGLFFKDGDIIAMIGDSITYNGQWWNNLREQLIVRHPELKCDFRNLGIPGGGAGQAITRYEWDIAPIKPTVAMVMFGMNDVWRDAYISSPTDDMITGRDECLMRFLQNTDALVSRLLNDGIRVVLFTPSPYDQYNESHSAVNLKGVDDALAICGGMVRGIAISRQFKVIDFHTILRRKCDDGMTIIGDDRVHPNDAGYEEMANIVKHEFLCGDDHSVPSDIHSVCQSLLEMEKNLRIIAMFRCCAALSNGGHDDESVISYIANNFDEEKNPWVREHMQVCMELLNNKDDLNRSVESLRQQIADFK